MAMVLGIIFGISFPTTYKITDKTISELEALNLPKQVINTLKTDKKKFEATRENFAHNLQLKLDVQMFEKHKEQIIQVSKYNPYLPYVSWLGELFLRALSMITIPLIISSVISSTAGIKDADRFSAISIKIFFYYLSTGFLAIITALVFVHIIKPGVSSDVDLNIVATSNVETPGLSFFGNIKNIVPLNIVSSISAGHILSIIFFSLLVGFFATLVAKKHKKVLLTFFDAFYEMMINITNWVIKFAPLGIFGITAVIVSEINDYNEVYDKLGKYIFTVLIAFLFHSVIILPFILKFLFGTAPWQHYKAVKSAIVMAFVSSSSSVALPMTMNLVEQKSGVSKNIAGFTLPLGASVNIDGTALYELIAVFFIAQVYGVELSIIEIIVVAASTILVSISASSVPMSNAVVMSIILNTVGLPLEGITIIILADRFLNMFKSAVKVWSDSCGAVIIAKSEGEELKISN